MTAALIVLGFPEGADFGIDVQSWRVGPRFKGVQSIPPGIHFVHYNARDSLGHPSVRSGFFHVFRDNEALVRKRDAGEELLADETDCVQAERVRCAVPEFRKHMAHYPADQAQRWRDMAGLVTASTLARLQPTSRIICSATGTREMQREVESEILAAKKRLVEQGDALSSGACKGGAEPSGGGASSGGARSTLRDEKENEHMLGFTNIVRKRVPPGSSASEITKHMMDRSYGLACLINEEFSKDSAALLGELQFAFTVLVLGNVLGGLSQWKAIMDLLCNCEAALVERKDFYMTFTRIIESQLRELPEDFFSDMHTTGNFLTTVLSRYFENVALCPNVDPQLEGAVHHLRDNVVSRFGWTFDVADIDDAPLIVDL